MARKEIIISLLGLCITVGCGANQQWVKEYVGKETVSVRTEFRERLQPLEQNLSENKTQLEALKKDIVNINASLGNFQGKLDDMSKSLGDISQGYKTEITGVRQDVDQEINDLQEKVKDLKDKMGKLGTGLITFQKSIEQLSKRLEAISPQPVTPTP